MFLVTIGVGLPASNMDNIALILEWFRLSPPKIETLTSNSLPAQRIESIVPSVLILSCETEFRTSSGLSDTNIFSNAQ